MTAVKRKTWKRSEKTRLGLGLADNLSSYVANQEKYLHRLVPLSLFRPANLNDLDGICALVADAEPGMTTLPKTREAVLSQIEESLRCINGDTSANRLLFVIEHDNRIYGMSAILPEMGRDRPYYSFKLSQHSRKSTHPKLQVKYTTVHLTTDLDGTSALATLFLSKAARGKGLGKTLSLGRLAFAATHPELLSTDLIADLRGWFDDNGHSPFWDGFTSKFIDLPLDVADRLSVEDGRFILELVPAIPIILEFLPPSVAECAGKVHETSARAMAILMKTGFTKTDLVDVFEGGPSIICKAEKTVVAREKTMAAGVTDDSETTSPLLHFTGKGEQFRATIQPGSLAKAAAAPNVHDILDATDADTIWLAPIEE